MEKFKKNKVNPRDGFPFSLNKFRVTMSKTRINFYRSGGNWITTEFLHWNHDRVFQGKSLLYWVINKNPISEINRNGKFTKSAIIWYNDNQWINISILKFITSNSFRSWIFEWFFMIRNNQHLIQCYFLSWTLTLYINFYHINSG